jgi:hypothetical protein
MDSMKPRGGDKFHPYLKTCLEVDIIRFSGSAHVFSCYPSFPFPPQFRQIKERTAIANFSAAERSLKSLRESRVEDGYALLRIENTIRSEGKNRQAISKYV